MAQMNLDVGDPEAALKVLREAVDAYLNSAEELASAWQDLEAGRPWQILAEELEEAADRVERRLRRESVWCREAAD